MQIHFQRTKVLIRDNEGNVVIVERKQDGDVVVLLNGHVQGGLEPAS